MCIWGYATASAVLVATNASQDSLQPRYLQVAAFSPRRLLTQSTPLLFTRLLSESPRLPSLRPRSAPPSTTFRIVARCYHREHSL